MPRTRNAIQALNLYKYDVLIEDKNIRSDYFKITQFDGYFYGGRNAFLISGATVLKPNSKLLVEILNVNGETIYSAPVSDFVEGGSRLVKVEVYGDTPPGPGKLIILGCADFYLDGTPIPPQWKNKYNIRWISDVVISPRVENKCPIRFETTPSMVVTEKFYAAPSSSQYIETITLPINVKIAPKNYNVFQNGYLITLTGSSNVPAFQSDFIGGRLSGSIAFSGSSGVETALINLPITKIYNQSLAEADAITLTTDHGTTILSAFISSSGIYSSSINSDIPTVINSNLNLVYSKLETFFTGSGLSFAEVRIVDLETLSGEVHHVRVSFKNTTSPGDYIVLGDIKTDVRELYVIDSGSIVVDTGDFSKIDISKYWYAATMSLEKNAQITAMPNYYISSSLVSQSLITRNGTDLLNAISATPSIVNGTFIDNKSYFIGTTYQNTATLFPRSEYTLAFNAFVNSVSGSTVLSQDDSSLEIYLVGDEITNPKLLSTDPRGQLIGTLTPSEIFQKQNFERVQFNFVPKIIESGKFGLRFVVYGGHWSIADVSVKPAEEPYFSPDEINVLLPMQNYEQDILTFQAEFLDVNHNSAGILVQSTPVYFTGSSDYVKKIGDSMTGELYIKGLPVQQQILQDAFTGLITGGNITVNTPASWSYTIGSGSGYVVNSYTDPLNPSYTYVTWPNITRMPATFASTGSVASYPRTNIAISASGEVIEQFAEWNAQDYRKYIILGRIAHVGTTYIQRSLSLPLTTYNRGFHWFDLANAIGIITVEGNVFYPSGSSMSIGKTAGKTYRVGSNYKNDITYPDITTDPASLPTQFAYRYRSGSVFLEEPVTTVITGSKYDDGSGVLATATPNKFTVQRIYYFGATNTTRIQFGQNIYNTMQEAVDAALAEQFIVDPNLERDSALRAYLVVGTSATNLSNTTQAQFILAGKISGAGGAGGARGASKLSELTDVTITNPTTGQFLQYNGSSWVNGLISASIFGTSSWAISSSYVLPSGLPPGTVSASGQVSYTGLSNIPSGIVSSSSQINTGSFSGSFIGTSSWAISSSVALTANVAPYSGLTGIPAGIVSASSQINHNATTNYVANQHIDHTTVNINAGLGLSGGGDISTNRTLTVDTSSAHFTNGVKSKLNTDGVISSSAQVSYTGLTNIPANIVSSSGQISHNSTTGYVANEHINHTSVSISAGNGLSGGGDISTNRTLTLDTNSVTFTNGVKSKMNTDSVVSSSGQISHNSTTGYVANEHINHTSVSISAGNGLSGGGDISTNRTLTLDTNSSTFTNGVKSKMNTDGVVSSSGQISHNSTTGYVANEHINHTSVSITAGNGLSGGGDISATRTLTLDTNSSTFTDGVKSKLNADGVISSSAQVRLVGNQAITGSLTISGSTYTRNIVEFVVGTSSAPPSTLNYNVLDGAILFHSASTSANWTLNFRGNASTTLDSIMPVSSSLTVTLLTLNSSTPYSSSTYQIDGTAITPRWQGGISGSANANSLDAHTFTIIKIRNTPSYILLGSITRYT